MKPVLKWAGGKHKISQKIVDVVGDFNNYWEPFAGSASVALEIFSRKKCEIFLSDINDDLVNFYKCLKESYIDFVFEILKVQDEFIKSGDKLETYLRFREEFNSSVEKDKRSVLFYFLNKTSFNGLTRYNSKGKFNVPFGKRSFSVDLPALEKFSEFLNSSRVHLSNGEFCNIVPERFDFVYLDPPYHPLNVTSSFTSYHAVNWNEASERALKAFCDELHKKQVQFVLSNNDVEFIRVLFSEYEISTLDVRKSVGAKKETRKKSPELLIFSKIDLQTE